MNDQKAFSSILFSLRKRLSWLHVNLATAFMAAVWRPGYGTAISA